MTRPAYVKTCVWDGPYIKIQLESSEKQALRCIHEINKVIFKGENVRAKFSEGSYEDKPSFRERNEEFFKNYPKELMPHTEQACPLLAQFSHVDYFNQTLVRIKVALFSPACFICFPHVRPSDASFPSSACFKLHFFLRLSFRN